MESIFYKGQSIFDERSVSINEALGIYLGPPDMIDVVSFSTPEGVFNICYRGESPLFITKKVQEISPPHKNANRFHKNFIEKLGVIVECVNSKPLENIQYLFMNSELSKPEIDFLIDDYAAKCNKANLPLSLDMNQLVLLGQDSDGKKLLYDVDDNIHLYCLDPSISEEEIIKDNNHPDETFYTCSQFKKTKDIIGLLFKRESNL